MTQPIDIITRAMKDIGAVAAGEVPTAENSGYASQRALYEYTCYAGSADLGTGFDSGTIMNGTLRSYSGTTPAWLRLSSNTVQMNVTGTSYGLNYKIVMRRVYPG